MNAKLKEFLDFSIHLLIIFVLCYLLIHFVGQRTVVNGSSMESTLSNGDNLIIDKISYRFSDPERYDVIVFPYVDKKNTYYIKRIIGLPGETVQIDTEGNIYIDGAILDEDYGLETIADPGVAVNPITLGEDEYFVMGDNRNNSSDSRAEDVGTIDRDIIIGRAWIRIFPFNEMGSVKNIEHAGAAK